MVPDREQRRALVNKVMDVEVPQYARKSLSS
jgi:hypothetical protein